MRLCNESHSYASIANAEKALTKALAHVGRTLDDTRYLVAVNKDGRYVPVVVPSDMEVNVMFPLVSLGISIVK